MKGGGSGGGGPSRSQRQRPKKTGMGSYVARLILGASVPKEQGSFFFFFLSIPGPPGQLSIITRAVRSYMQPSTGTAESPPHARNV